MAPKKATKEIKVQDTETPEVDTSKKAPPKRVRKPKEEKEIETNIVVSSESSDNKLENFKKRLTEYAKQHEKLQAELEKLDISKQALLEEMTKELEVNINSKITNKNSFTLDKPSTSGTKTSNIKMDSDDSSNDKESSENDTNSDDDSDSKTKVTKKGKNIKQPNKAPAKSRAKAKVTSVPVLQHDESDSDNE